MACYHPLHAFDTGYTSDNGKPVLIIKSSDFEWIYQPSNKEAALEKSQKLKDVFYDKKITEYVEIPCGKCIGCRLNYSRQWATRCMLEAREHNNNQFVTLTYNDCEITTNEGLDIETGEVKQVGTLVPEHLTKFMKDLRRYYEYHYQHTGIRFYACGEYGATTKRLHYHLIIFNLPIYDKKYLFTNNNKDKIYTSEMLEKIWGRGIVSVGDVTWNSAAYVARYIMKKIKGPNAEEFYKAHGIVPEFVRMSRKEGIGKNYYDQNKDKIYKNDEIILTNIKGLAEIVKPCKYYDKLYDLDNPEAMKAIKEYRQKRAKESMQQQLSNTSLNKEDYLATKERVKENSLKRLKRTLD